MRDIHPNYDETAVTCSCGNTFTTRSTVKEIHAELCSECHPFYTGKQKLVDTGGRVERFTRRFGDQATKRKSAKETNVPEADEAPAAADEAATDEAPEPVSADA